MLTGSIFLNWVILVSIAVISIDAQSTANDPNAKKSTRILSRKRRFLIFPVGSSVQLVYDSTVTIPDYTLLVTTGVTCALAWGLPDKPLYGDEYMEQYEDGHLPFLEQRIDKNVTEPIKKVNGTKPAAYDHNAALMKWFNQLTRYAQYANEVYSANSGDVGSGSAINKYYNYFHRQPDSYYFGNDNYQSCKTGNCAYNPKISHTVGDKASQSPYNTRPPLAPNQRYDPFTNFVANTYFKPWLESDSGWAYATTSPAPPKKTTKSKATKPPTTSTTPEFKPVINKLHTIYPAMGKRSIPDPSASYAKKFYIDHHRNTRHELYGLIEKYLFAKGFNGTECVLKTLCEVGQKRNDSEPGSFLAEIVRAIFSLPNAQLKRVIDKRHIDYDDAHQTDIDCSAKYSLCPASIWTAGYLVDGPDL